MPSTNTTITALLMAPKNAKKKNTTLRNWRDKLSDFR
jgi:gas vesicle protein